ncbi:MAG: M48 family metalloprotease [Thermoguttaceae bacterium]|nr:M48 family metalloprotease [Thermoguttaceae bacterium]
MDNSLEYNTYAEMERLAVDELKKRGLYRAPVDVRRLARELGLEIYSANFKNSSISGLIRKERIGWTSREETIIYFNRALNPDCVRFVIAHEIGHWYLGHLEQNPDGIFDAQLDLYRRRCGVDSELERRSTPTGSPPPC